MKHTNVKYRILYLNNTDSIKLRIRTYYVVMIYGVQLREFRFRARHVNSVQVSQGPLYAKLCNVLSWRKYSERLETYLTNCSRELIVSGSTWWRKCRVCLVCRFISVCRVSSGVVILSGLYQSLG